jgi:hypothetical protein
VPVIAQIEGAKEAVAYLKQFDKQVIDGMNKELYVVMKDLVNQTRRMVPFTAPMSGWEKTGKGEWGTRLRYNPNRVRTGIRSKLGWYRQRGNDYRERGYFLVNANPAGMVYEWAGRKNRNGQPWNPRSTSKNVSHSKNPKAGQQFIENIVNASGMTVIGKQGRLVWLSAYNNRKRVAQRMETIIQGYVRSVNQKLAA